MYKRLFAALVLLAMLSACADKAETMMVEWMPPAESSAAILENNRLFAVFDNETGMFSVLDKRSSTAYLSNPPETENDGIAKGLAKMEMRSQLTIETLTSSGQVTVSNSARECADGGIYMTQTEEAVQVIYHFVESGFVIPLTYQLTEDNAFSVSVDCQNILALGENQLVSLTLLPYFGAGEMEEDGFLFVPDGSGALIRFNSDAYVYQSYNQPVYGRDPALAVLDNSETRQQIMLPVFGINREIGGFTAIITEGAAHGRISADIARKKTAYNTVYSGIRFIHSETERFMAGTASATDMRVYSPFMPPETYTVCYYFMDKEQNSVTDMADIYTAYLQPERQSFLGYGTHLDLYGAISVDKTWLGVPYTAAETLTSVEQLRDIAMQLQDMGVSPLDIRYLGWQKGGLNTKTPVKLSAREGSRKLKNISEILGERGIALNLAVDFVNLYRAGNGFSATFDVARNISRAPAYQYSFMLSTGSRNTAEKPWNLLTLEKSVNALTGFTQKVQDAGFTHLSLSGNTNLIYSNFDKNGHSPDEAEKAQQAAISEASRKVTLQMEQPYGYALSGCSSVINTPVSSSGFDAEWQSVPFYSIVLSGFIPCYSQPVNLRGDANAYVLECVAAGVMPSYALTYGGTDTLRDSVFSYLYSAEYPLWREKIAATHSKLSDSLSVVYGKRITNYTWLEHSLSVTRYENGVSVYVNRSGRDIEAEGIIVPAMDFIVVG